MVGSQAAVIREADFKPRFRSETVETPPDAPNLYAYQLIRSSKNKDTYNPVQDV